VVDFEIDSIAQPLESTYQIGFEPFRLLILTSVLVNHPDLMQ
jgi:hypothetical protein